MTTELAAIANNISTNANLKGQKTMTNETVKIIDNTNPDAITGEPGSHPVGTGIGAISVGSAAILLGAATAGPVGAVAGAVIGAIAGGLAGKDVAESFNPTQADLYWQTNYSTRPYISKDVGYDYYRPAYNFGYEQRSKNPNKKFEEIEANLSQTWRSTSTNSSFEWGKARDAVRDSYELDDGFYDIKGNTQIRERKDGE